MKRVTNVEVYNYVHQSRPSSGEFVPPSYPDLEINELTRDEISAYLLINALADRLPSNVEKHTYYYRSRISATISAIR